MKKKLFTVLIVITALIAGCGAKNENTEIIGGADGPTSIFIAGNTVDSDIEVDSDIDDTALTAIMDRVLVDYDYEPVAWSNTIEFKEDADILVKMAEDSTGRYKAYGIVSKEEGAFGIILDDTIDGTDSNLNYIYEKWYYTMTPNDEPYFSWNNDELYLTDPIPADNDTGYVVKTVKIDCGYDTGHMEF